MDKQSPTLGQAVFHQESLKFKEKKNNLGNIQDSNGYSYLASLPVVELSLIHPPSQQVQRTDPCALSRSLY